MAINYTPSAIEGMMRDVPNMLLQAMQANRQFEFSREQAAIQNQQAQRELAIQEDKTKSTSDYYRTQNELAQQQFNEATEQNDFEREQALRDQKQQDDQLAWEKKQADMLDARERYRIDQMYGNKKLNPAQQAQMKNLRMQEDRYGALPYIKEKIGDVPEKNYLIQEDGQLRINQAPFAQAQKVDQYLQEYVNQLDVPESEDPARYRRNLLASMQMDDEFRGSLNREVGEYTAGAVANTISALEQRGVSPEQTQHLLKQSPILVASTRSERLQGDPTIGQLYQSLQGGEGGLSEPFMSLLGGQLSAYPEEYQGMTPEEMGDYIRKQRRMKKRQRMEDEGFFRVMPYGLGAPTK